MFIHDFAYVKQRDIFSYEKLRSERNKHSEVQVDESENFIKVFFNRPNNYIGFHMLSSECFIPLNGSFLKIKVLRFNKTLFSNYICSRLGFWRCYMDIKIILMLH